MSQTALLDDVSITLLKHGYTVKTMPRMSIDLIARKGSQILLLKVLQNANAANELFAAEMKRIASCIGASPLIIAERSGTDLEDHVVYSRFDVFVLNPTTFKNCIESRFPFAKKSKAGLTTKLLGDKLKELRERNGISLGALSKELGVSRNMADKYEKGTSEITIQKAMKVYDLFGDKVFEKIDVFNSRFGRPFDTVSPLAQKYHDLGFDTVEATKAPFDIMAKLEKEIILTEIGDKMNPLMRSLSRLIDADNLMIFDKKKPKSDDIPTIKRSDFLDFENAKELIEFLKESI